MEISLQSPLARSSSCQELLPSVHFEPGCCLLHPMVHCSSSGSDSKQLLFVPLSRPLIVCRLQFPCWKVLIPMENTSSHLRTCLSFLEQHYPMISDFPQSFSFSLSLSLSLSRSCSHSLSRSLSLFFSFQLICSQLKPELPTLVI